MVPRGQLHFDTMKSVTGTGGGDGGAATGLFDAAEPYTQNDYNSKFYVTCILP